MDADEPTEEEKALARAQLVDIEPGSAYVLRKLLIRERALRLRSEKQAEELTQRVSSLEEALRALCGVNHTEAWLRKHAEEGGWLRVSAHDVVTGREILAAVTTPGGALAATEPPAVSRDDIDFAESCEPPTEWWKGLPRRQWCPSCGDCEADCCNPECRGMWGTGCYHCHFPSFGLDPSHYRGMHEPVVLGKEAPNLDPAELAKWVERVKQDTAHEPDAWCTTHDTGVPCGYCAEGMPACGKVEAPPAGEPGPDPWAYIRTLRNDLDYIEGDGDIITTQRRIDKFLAKQPAPASPPRDESVPPPGDTMAYYRVLPMRWGRSGEVTGWYIDVDPPHAPFATREAAIAHCEQHRARILAGYAPTVSREVDEAAADRYRIEIDLPEDVYPHERWVREVNKTCADLGLAECRIVAVGVDDAAVRAPLGEALKRWNDWHPDDGFGCDKFALLVDSMNALAKAYRTTERPAASGKDGAT